MALRRITLRVFFSLAVTFIAAMQALSMSTEAGPIIARDDPEVMLKQATDELLAISKAAREYADQDRERYYAEVSGVLDQIMDIQYFARGVMATYASARAYKALKSEAERAAFRDRVSRFAVALKRVWLVKYADALLKADGEKIELTRIKTGDDNSDRASVEQKITDAKNEVYLVQYSLHKVKDGGWMIANVIVEAVNLGQSYRNQFAEAVENNRGDVDYVVDHWVELMLHEPSSQSLNSTGGE